MHRLINEILLLGFVLTIKREREAFSYTIDGFYKSVTVRLFVFGDKLLAISRYDERTEIESFSDLVTLNYSWWRRSVNIGYDTPDSAWLPHLIKAGYVKEITETKTRYEAL